MATWLKIAAFGWKRPCSHIRFISINVESGSRSGPFKASIIVTMCIQKGRLTLRQQSKLIKHFAARSLLFYALSKSAAIGAIDPEGGDAFAMIEEGR